MILTTLAASSTIESLHPGFKKFFDFLAHNDLNTMPLGRVEIDGEQLFFNIVESRLMAPEQQILEVHRQYIDVHIPLSGTEIIGWRALDTLSNPSQPYDPDKDCEIYTAQPTTYINVLMGECLVAFPEDAHAPIIGHGTIRKAIVKISR